ncbi:MAG TPA: FecR domain-containing protein [Chitinophagaceae bacterium]|nr:FecR domain-containing protein [Chitinophagaceae bacterium]
MSPLSNEQIELLAEKKLLGTITPEEQELLDQWVNSQQSKSSEKTYWNSVDTDETILKNRLLARIKEDANIGEPAEVSPKIRPMQWRRVAVAASVLLIIGLSSYFIFFRAGQKTINPPIAVNGQHTGADALPGSSGAILTTANGQQVILDSANNGLIATEGNTSVNKEGPQLQYQPNSDAAPVYNTLTTPKGRKFELLLADGTKVWLDAGSSITYPTAFTGNERNVKASGQVYFEVARDASKPFTVSVGDMDVQVLGTHFNINAYPDETTVKTTLLEGSVKVTKNKQSQMLKPGEQAQVSSNENIKIITAVDIDAVMAWKNGLFSFNHADLATVLLELSRWYDMEVVYEGEISTRAFDGKIGRDLNLSQVLKGLQKTQVNFRIDGNKLIVMP